MKTAGKAARAYFPTIDLLRFASALSVALFHLGYTSWVDPNSNAARLVDGKYQIPLGALFWWGNVGVPIFFVISGFVIAASANGASPFSFARSRIERLYPAAWVCATVTAAVWIITHYYGWPDLAARYAKSVTLWPFGPWIDGQYWTLRVEIGFYACVFLLILTNQVRRFEAFASLLVALGCSAFATEVAERAGLLPLGTTGNLTGNALGMLPIYYGAYFGLGMLFWLRRAGFASVISGPFIIAGLVAGAAQVGLRAHADTVSAIYPAIRASWFVPVIVWISAAALIGWSRPVMLDSAEPESRSLRLIRSCGLATYPLYLIHFGLGVWIIRSLVTAGLPPLASLAVALAITIAAAAFVAEIAEPAIRRVLRQAFKRLENILPARAFERVAPVKAGSLPTPTIEPPLKTRSI